MELFLGFYFGTLSMISLYNLHWYSVTKEKSYLYYALFKVAIMFILIQDYQIIQTGTFLTILNANIIFLLILLFSKEFLGLSKNFKKINIVMNCAMVFVVLCFLYSVLTGNYAIFDQPYSLMLSPFVILGYFVYRNGFKPAKYYMVAWGISILLIGLEDFAAPEMFGFYPAIPTLIGHMIESIILTYAIFVKTDLIVKEKEQQSKMLIHQAKLASMGQMLENISHQWRQPLNRIAAFIINMRVYIEDKYKKEEYLLDALKQSQLQLEYMSNTINDFTNFNKQATDKENFLASSVIESVYKIVHKTLENNNIVFDVKSKADFSIYSYPNELDQVVLNLIQNAQDALVKRQVEKAVITVVIETGKISIQDNAGGIEGDIIDKIFEPYFTTKSKATSLGLGLYMSKIILEKNFNAKIELEQVKARTSFHILFGSR